MRKVLAIACITAVSLLCGCSEARTVNDKPEASKSAETVVENTRGKYNVAIITNISSSSYKDFLNRSSIYYKSDTQSINYGTSNTMCRIVNYEILPNGLIEVIATDGVKYLSSAENIILIYDESLDE